MPHLQEDSSAMRLESTMKNLPFSSVELLKLKTVPGIRIRTWSSHISAPTSNLETISGPLTGTVALLRVFRQERLKANPQTSQMLLWATILEAVYTPNEAEGAPDSCLPPHDECKRDTKTSISIKSTAASTGLWTRLAEAAPPGERRRKTRFWLYARQIPSNSSQDICASHILVAATRSQIHV